MSNNQLKHAKALNGVGEPIQLTSFEAKFKLAIELIQNKKITDAKILFNEILFADPRHAESWFYSALIAEKEGSPQDAIRYLETALEIDSQNLKYLYTIGDFYYEQNYLEQGIKIFENIIKIQPDDYNGYYNLANFLQKQKKYDQAILNFQKVLELDDKNVNAIYNLGNIFTDIKEYKYATQCFTKVIQLQPNSDDALNNLGFLQLELGNYEEALEFLNKAISINPGSLSALNNLGKVHEKKSLYSEAIGYFNKAIKLNPNHAESYSNLAAILIELMRFEDAIVYLHRALDLDPNMPSAYNNTGKALYKLNRLDEALLNYTRAIDIFPDYVEAYTNLGVLFDELFCHDKAIINFDKAILIKNNYADAYWNKALSLLRCGDFRNGFILYEWRWKVDGLELKNRPYDQPLWLGNENIQNKTILLYAEQGLGDTIQFCRYAKLVKELGAIVLLEVPKPLLSLLSDLEGVDLLIESGNKLPDFDYHCPLMSLPLAFKSELASIPNRNPYLAVDNNKHEKWVQKLGVKPKLQVGLVWSGSTTHKNDHNRSLTLKQLLPYLSDLCEYVSLQKEVREIDKQVLNGSNIKQHGDELNDFSDTAALCELMDLVISVDTSVAHLAGAIGKTTWVLLPHVPDWRWLLDREDSPWYPSIKIYRQPSHGDWDSVMKRIRHDLIEYSNNWKLR